MPGYRRTLGIVVAFAALLVPATSASAQVTFSSAPNVTLGAVNTAHVTTADFNGDGRPDLAVPYDAGTPQTSRVAVRLGNGSGGFSSVADVPVGAGLASRVAVGDFNRDGRQDFATALFTADDDSGRVAVRLGNGSGGFSAAPDVAVGLRPQSLAVGDFNGDARPDLAVANSHSAVVSIRLGNGAGGFSAAPDVAVASGPISIALGDFNGDGRTDFAVGTVDSQAASASVRFGNGSGGFTAGPDLPLPGSASFVAVGDFNGDGRQDLAVATEAQAVVVRLGAANNGFSSAPNIPSEAQGIAVADFNNDGRQDLALTKRDADRVSVQVGNGAGGFSASPDVTVGDGPLGLASADFNGDGRPDLAVMNHASSPRFVSILLNTTPGANTYAGVVLGDNPVGYWRFGEASGGVASDSSGRGNHATYLNRPSLGAAGALFSDPDKAVSLDGVNDYVRANDSASLDVGDSFTLEAWIKRDNDARVHQLFNKGGNGFHLVISEGAKGNQVWLRKTNVATIARTTGGVPPDGRFHHVVATKNGNDVRIYIDGVAQALQPASRQVIANTTVPLAISAASQPAGAIAGDIDEFAIYDNALTAAQVAEHYQAAGAP